MLRMDHAGGTATEVQVGRDQFQRGLANFSSWFVDVKKT